MNVSCPLVVVDVDVPQVVSDNAVFARDFLAGAYMASKDKAGEVAGATVHKTLQASATAAAPLLRYLLLFLATNFSEANKLYSETFRNPITTARSRPCVSPVLAQCTPLPHPTIPSSVRCCLQVYKFARDQSTTVELPGPLKPVRDHVLIPSFRRASSPGCYHTLRFSLTFVARPRAGVGHQGTEFRTTRPITSLTSSSAFRGMAFALVFRGVEVSNVFSEHLL